MALRRSPERERYCACRRTPAGGKHLINLRATATSEIAPGLEGAAVALAVRSADVKCAVRIVTLAGAVRELPPFPGPCRAVAWTHDEQAVLAAVHTRDGIPVFMVGARGIAPPIRLQSPQIQTMEISPSPDGRALLLGVGNPRPDVWTLSGFGSASTSGR